ncbi:unnamed protein product [Closterium sp. NIES-54]
MCKRPDFPADITGDDSISLDFPAQSQSGWPPGAHGAAAAAHLAASQFSMPPFTLHYPTASPAAASHAAAGAASQHLDWLACGPAFLSPVSLLPAFPSPGPLLVPPPLLDASNPTSDMTARLSASHGLASPRGAWTSAAKPAAMRGSPPSPAAATATSALAAAQTAASASTAAAGAAAGGGAGMGVGMGAGMGTGGAPWMSFMGPSLAMGPVPQGFLMRPGAAQGHEAGRIPVMSEKKQKRRHEIPLLRFPLPSSLCLPNLSPTPPPAPSFLSLHPTPSSPLSPSISPKDRVQPDVSQAVATDLQVNSEVTSSPSLPPSLPPLPQNRVQPGVSQAVAAAAAAAAGGARGDGSAPAGGWGGRTEGPGGRQCQAGGAAARAHGPAAAGSGAAEAAAAGRATVKLGGEVWKVVEWGWRGV